MSVYLWLCVAPSSAVSSDKHNSLTPGWGGGWPQNHLNSPRPVATKPLKLTTSKVFVGMNENSTDRGLDQCLCLPKHLTFPCMSLLILFCCCSVAKLCLTLHDPLDYNTPGFPVPHHLPICPSSYPLSR